MKERILGFRGLCLKYALLMIMLFVSGGFTACVRMFDDLDTKVEADEEVESTVLSNPYNFRFTRALNEELYKTVYLIQDSQSGVLRGGCMVTDSLLIASFETDAIEVYVGGVAQESGVTVNDFSTPVTYSLLYEDGVEEEFVVEIVTRDDRLPHIYITVENGAEVLEKEYYDAEIMLSGGESFDDLPITTTRIKGRGNATWSYPKKPYKLKLDEAASLCGLTAEREWVLLANYVDPSFMLNSMAMKMGQMLDIPYTNTMIPVNLTINGTYRGSYVLTEQIEVNENRINLSDSGYLLELDTYYDEDLKFYSSILDLPVMLKDEASDIYESGAFLLVKMAFNELEAFIMSDDFPNNSYEELIDLELLAKFMVVNQVMMNREVGGPRSTYIYKDVDRKFSMGPLWDFDVTCGFGVYGLSHFKIYDTDIFAIDDLGIKFFERFLLDPNFLEIYNEEWEALSDQLSELMEYAEEYTDLITTSALFDYTLWWANTPRSYTFEEKSTEMQEWFQLRFDYISTYLTY